MVKLKLAWRLFLARSKRPARESSSIPKFDRKQPFSSVLILGIRVRLLRTFGHSSSVEDINSSSRILCGSRHKGIDETCIIHFVICYSTLERWMFCLARGLESLSKSGQCGGKGFSSRLKTFLLLQYPQVLFHLFAVSHGMTSKCGSQACPLDN